MTHPTFYRTLLVSIPNAVSIFRDAVLRGGGEDIGGFEPATFTVAFAGPTGKSGAGYPSASGSVTADRVTFSLGATAFAQVGDASLVGSVTAVMGGVRRLVCRLDVRLVNVSEGET